MTARGEMFWRAFRDIFNSTAPDKVVARRNRRRARIGSLTKAERAVVRRSLQDRRSLLLEKIGDTAEARRTHEAAQRELDSIASVLAKMKNR